LENIFLHNYSFNSCIEDIILDDLMGIFANDPCYFFGGILNLEWIQTQCFVQGTLALGEELHMFHHTSI
jgi:hypothetical protein